ncbi:MAG: helicase-related protein, partial [Candidatus Eisenbacteria bacterium]
MRSDAGVSRTGSLPPGTRPAAKSGSWSPDVAARAAARRVAEEVGCALGQEVGYQVRFERRVSPATRVRFVTEGILTRRLLSDPELSGIDCVVFDEYHERSLDADLGLALTREVQATLRPDLRIVVMSATLDSDELSLHLGGAPVLRVPGRTHPIEIDHLDRPDAPPMPVGVRMAFEHLLEDGLRGSVLVFVPGAWEIQACLRELDPALRKSGYVGMRLHGDQRPEEQDAAIASRERRVVVSTNLAEASVTVQGIEAVIDSGRVRVARFDPWVGVDRLRTERISRASAVQRAGRAGRLGPGRCVRLYTEDELARWQPFAEPEISRVDLSQTVLALKGWGTTDVRTVQWPSPPPEDAVRRAERLLHWLGALDGDTAASRITDLGRKMLLYPLPPRHARVLVEAEALGVTEDAALWVALAGERDPRRRDEKQRRSGGPAHGTPHRAKGRVAKDPVRRNASRASAQGDGGESDLAILEDKVRAAAAGRFARDVLDREGVDGRTVRRIVDVAEQLGRIVRQSRGKDADKQDVAAAIDSLLSGAPSMSRDEALRRALLA